MTYRFTFIRTTKDPSGYYQTRWDMGIELSVTADTEPEAVKKAQAASGPMYGGRSGDRWAFKVVRFDEIESAEHETS